MCVRCVYVHTRTLMDLCRTSKTGGPVPRSQTSIFSSQMSLRARAPGTAQFSSFRLCEYYYVNVPPPPSAKPVTEKYTSKAQYRVRGDFR